MLLDGVAAQPDLSRPHDRTADRRESRRRRAARAGRARRSPDFAPRPAARPALPRCWSARIRRAPSMSAPRARRRVEAGMESFAHNLPADDQRGRAARPGRAAQRRSARSTGSSSSCRCRRRSTRTRVHRRDRPGQGRRRLPPGQRRPARDRPRRARALHAARLPDPAQGRARRPRRPGRGGGRPLEHRRQADGAAAARRNCTVTIAHSRTRDLPDVVRRADIVVAAVGRAGDGPRRLDQARRDRHRRRHQPRRAADDGKRRLVGDVAFDEAARGRRRDHAGPGRRRADDHRHATQQHAGRRAPPRRPAPIRKAFECSHCCLPPPLAADRESMPSAPSPRDAQRIGQWTAFRKYADRDAVMFTRRRCGRTSSSRTARTRRRRSRWWPAQSYRLVRRPDRGQHRAVGARRRQGVSAISPPSGSARSGSWRWVYDGGDALKVARPPPRRPYVRRASCRGKAPGAPVHRAAAADREAGAASHARG